MDVAKLRRLATFLRYWSLRMTTSAGSGHPTSSLSAADLMTTLFATTFRFDFANPDNPANDRLIFSKGHATPLYYALFAAVGALKSGELDDYRKFGSILEGHATPRFPYVEAATGSLGQGLSIGVGMAIALRAKYQISNIKYQKEEKDTLGLNIIDASRVTENAKDTSDGVRHSQTWLGRLTSRMHSSEVEGSKEPPRVFVLLGDGEMAEGNIWEAIEIASKYRLNNLIAILDVNRLGQSEETMLGHDVMTYQKRLEAFGWETKVIDGHDYNKINTAMRQCNNVTMEGKPYMIIAKTIKGKGVSFLENKEGWHGKPLPSDLLNKALFELGEVDLKLRIKVHKPEAAKLKIKNEKLKITIKNSKINYKLGEEIATRKAYGTALSRLGDYYPDIVALDGDVKNSTYSEIFKEKYPGRFFEMYIAEQNMVGTAVGFSRLGIIPFVSTFAAFLTRAFDQIRMAAISGANIKFCGSHAGVSIGEDGPSQMGLEDFAMFRAVHGSVVLYPADSVSTEKLVEEMVNHRGISYLRTTRPTTPVIYANNEEFPIGGCKIHYLKNPKSQTPNPKQIQNSKPKIIIIAAGITLYEALKAQEELIIDGIETIVVDCYSVKPIDEKTLRSLVFSPINNQQSAISNIFVVEDHWFEGGLGDSVLNVFAGGLYQDRQAKPIQDRINRINGVRVYKLAVTKMPRSGKPQELLDYEDISSSAIIRKIKEIL